MLLVMFVNESEWAGDQGAGVRTTGWTGGRGRDIDRYMYDTL